MTQDQSPSPHGASNKNIEDPRKLPNANASFALDRVRFMLAAYGSWKPDDSERYLENLIAVLSEFPESVVAHATDSRTGVQARHRYLPTAADLRAACEARFEQLLVQFEAAIEPERRAAAALEEARLAEERSKRLTLKELLTKYGHNGRWLPEMKDPLREDLARRIEERDRAAHERFVLREYHLHGLRPVFWNDRPITLSTARQMEMLGKLTIERADPT